MTRATRLNPAVRVQDAAVQLVVNVKTFGAVGDGTTDDGRAIRSAVAFANAISGIVHFPAGSYYYKATGPLSLAAGVTLRGAGSGSTKILFDVVTAGTFTQFVTNAGDDITIKYLTIQRVSDFPAVIFPISSHTGFSVRRCTLDGQRDTLTTNYCHGFETGLQNTGVTDDVLIDQCRVTRCSEGLFQTNDSTSTVHNITVRDTTFAYNTGADLDFNAPNGTQTDVLVDGCRFRNNQGTTAGTSIGVGFAHIVRAKVVNSSFVGYNREAIHIEDYSSSIVIAGNDFTDCGLLADSYIQIISGARGVSIFGNTFDASNNNDFINLIALQAGGVGDTPGGRPGIAPSRIGITGNTLLLGPCGGIYSEVVIGLNVTGNTIVGSSSVSGGVFSGANGANGIEIYDGADAVVSGNIIRGVGAAFAIEQFNITPFNNGGSITGNTISNCNFGLVCTNAGPAAITGNNMFNCVYPAVLGEGAKPPFPTVFANNHAYGCTYQMQIYGNALAISGGTATTGSAKTLTVQRLALKIPSGTPVVFSGGGTLTLTTDAMPDDTSLTGNLAGANIASGETGLATGLTYSSTLAQNHYVVKNNGDSVLSSGYGQAITKTANYTLTMAHADQTVLFNGASLTATVPSATVVPSGTKLGVKNLHTSRLTLASLAGTIDGSSSASVAQYQSLYVMSDGANWWII